MLRRIFYHREARTLASQRPAIQTPPDDVEQPTSTSPPKRRLPAYAWACHDLCDDGIRRRNTRKAVFYCQLHTLSAVAVIAAVLYGHLYDGYPALEDLNLSQWGLFATTFVVPILIGLLQNKENDLLSADRYQFAAASIELENYKYRAEVKPYDNSKKVKDINKLLQMNLWRILQSVENEMEKDGKKLPSKDQGDFWIVGEPIDPRPKATATVTSSQSDKGYELDVPFAEDIPYLDLKKGTQPVEEPPTELTPILAKPTDETASDGSLASKENAQDDFFSMLSPADYVHLRLAPKLAQQQATVKSLQQRQWILQSLLSLITGASTVLALLTKQWIVPMLLAFSPPIQRMLQVSDVPHRLAIAVKAEKDLNDLQTAWFKDQLEHDGENPVSVDRMVTRSELIILRSMQP